MRALTRTPWLATAAVVVGLAAGVTTLDGTEAAHADEATPPVTVLGGDAAVPEAVTDQLTACAPGGVARWAGGNRYATAAEVSREAFPDGAGEVVVASGEGFADALAAGPAAANRDAALLLTAPDSVPEATAAELARLEPERVTVAGGPQAVSSEVEAELAAHAPVERVAGADRYATAAALAPDAADTVWVATGEDWPDALAAGAAAARDDAPVLLVHGEAVPEATAERLDALAPERVVVAGGDAAVSDDVVTTLEAPGRAVERVAGADRFATAAEVAGAASADPEAFLLATARAPADALAAVPFAARAEAALLLADGTSLPRPTVEALARAEALDCRAVELVPGPAESLALGGGVELTVTAPTGEVEIGSEAGRVLLDGAGTLEVAYPTPAALDEPVAWSQDVAATDDSVELSQPWRGEREPAPGGITLAWHATGSWADYRREVEAAPGLTVSSPVSMHLDASGELTGGVDAGFVAHAQARGVEVWPAIASLDGDVIRTALASQDQRSALAWQVSDRARRAGADGVNIDLEGWEHDTTEEVTDFVRRLTWAVHQWDGVTSIDLTSMTDSWATPPEEEYGHWSTAPQRRELSEAVDYVVLMAYDEHNRFRPAGPVASPAWVEEALRYQLRFTDPDRLILGVPLYGRVWAPDDLYAPRAVPMRTLTDLAAQGVRRPDPRFGVDRVELPDGRFTWLEDHAGLAHRVDLVEEYGLAGTASWRLGFDDPEVWRVLAE